MNHDTDATVCSIIPTIYFCYFLLLLYVIQRDTIHSLTKPKYVIEVQK